MMNEKPTQDSADMEEIQKARAQLQENLHEMKESANSQIENIYKTKNQIYDFLNIAKHFEDSFWKTSLATVGAGFLLSLITRPRHVKLDSKQFAQLRRLMVATLRKKNGVTAGPIPLPTNVGNLVRKTILPTMAQVVIGYAQGRAMQGRSVQESKDTDVLH